METKLKTAFETLMCAPHLPPTLGHTRHPHLRPCCGLACLRCRCTCCFTASRCLILRLGFPITRDSHGPDLPTLDVVAPQPPLWSGCRCPVSA